MSTDKLADWADVAVHEILKLAQQPSLRSDLGDLPKRYAAIIRAAAESAPRVPDAQQVSAPEGLPSQPPWSELDWSLAPEMCPLPENWREGEKNSPHGLDEHNNRIPMRDGNDCARELESWLASQRAGKGAAK